MMLFRGKTDPGKYYIREVQIGFEARTGAITTKEVFSEIYRELPDFGPGSKMAVLQVDGGSYFKSDYIFYTAASDPRKVLSRERKGIAAPSDFHTFDQEVVALISGVSKRNNCMIFFALADGTIMTYTPWNSKVLSARPISPRSNRNVSSASSRPEAKYDGSASNTEDSQHSANRTPRHEKAALRRGAGIKNVTIR